MAHVVKRKVLISQLSPIVPKCRRTCDLPARAELQQGGRHDLGSFPLGGSKLARVIQAFTMVRLEATIGIWCQMMESFEFVFATACTLKLTTPSG